MTATESFWIDPTHQRPILIQLLQFTVEYAGLTGIFRGDQRGWYAGRKSLWLAAEAHLNRRFYGPKTTSSLPAGQEIDGNNERNRAERIAENQPLRGSAKPVPAS